MDIRKIKRKRKKGFTLIELMIVLAVIALIGFIGLPNLTAIKDNVAVKVDKENCRNIERVTTYLMTDETLKCTPGTKFTYTPTALSNKLTTASATVTGKDELEKLLADISTPQQKEKTSYVIDIKSEGKVEVTTTGSTSD